MPITVESLNIGIFPLGVRKGLPCVFLTWGGGDNATITDANTIYEKVKESGLKLVGIQVSLRNNPDALDVIKGIASVGKSVVLVTDASDDIEPVRNIRGVSIILEVTPPTPEKNDINPKNFPILVEDDEILIDCSSREEYKNAVEFLTSRIITRPTVLFNFESSTDASIEDEVIADAPHRAYTARVV